MKASIASLGAFATADRMLRDYTNALYEPAAEQGRRLAANGFERARALAEWKGRVAGTWSDVHVLDVEGDVIASDVGEERTVVATVKLGRLATDDVDVQLAHGPVGANAEIGDPSLTQMTSDGAQDGIATYTATFTADVAGLHGFTVRVLPSNPDLTNLVDLGLVTWA